MRKLLLLLSLPILAGGAMAQSHSVVVHWTNSPDTANTNVYRFTGACPGTPAGFVKLTAAPVTAGTYSDTTVVPNFYCYYVTAALNGVESLPSPTVQVTVPVAPPSGLALTSVAILINGNQQTVTAKWTDDSGTQQDYFFSDGTKVLNRGLTSSASGTFAQQVKTAVGVPVRFTACNSVGDCMSQVAM